MSQFKRAIIALRAALDVAEVLADTEPQAARDVLKSALRLARLSLK